ncbi:MAG TPA: response regulator [Spirochaetota bacterium]|nr:response regulator [Spirochaetota bacterium]
MDAKKAIIRVGDEAIIVLSLKQELQSGLGDGYVYECAMSADEVRRIIDELCNEKVCVVPAISDWLMPGVKGDEFLFQINKQHPEIKSIPITGQSDESAIEQVLNEGAAGAVLKKPWDTEDLIREVRALCAGCTNGHAG